MDKVILMGRLTRDPEVRYSQGERQMAIARYTLAVDRRGRNATAGEQTADFLPCIAFDKAAEFAEKYFHQGTKLIVTGRIQAVSRPEATQTRMVRRYIPPTSLLRSRSLQKVRQQAMSRYQQLRQDQIRHKHQSQRQMHTAS